MTQNKEIVKASWEWHKAESKVNDLRDKRIMSRLDFIQNLIYITWLLMIISIIGASLL